MIKHKNTTYKIRRDGERALAFTGRIIGEGSDWTCNSFRWTNVTIYRTASDRIVVMVWDRTQWQGESDQVRADSFSTASAAIRYLRFLDAGDDRHEFDENDSILQPAAQAAIEAAGKNDDEFASANTETV